MARQYRTFICGGDYEHLQPRGDCPDSLHDWPLPIGYTEAYEVAHARLRARWGNRQCRQCGLYGWVPGERKPPNTHPVRVEAKGDALLALQLAVMRRTCESCGTHFAARAGAKYCSGRCRQRAHRQRSR